MGWPCVAAGSEDERTFRGGRHGTAGRQIVELPSMDAVIWRGGFIREQVRQVVAGGVPVFWRKLRAAARLVAAVVPILVTRLARPIVTVRIGAEFLRCNRALLD